MNQYVTGAVIKELREKNHLTQAELADRLKVSDKTVSKWETGKGYPEGNPEDRFEQVGTVPTCTVGKWGLSLLVQN